MCNCWVVERRDMGGVVDDLDSHRCACSGGGIDGLRGLWGLGILMLSASLINKCKEKTFLFRPFTKRNRKQN